MNKKRVLIIEDDETLSSLMREQLISAGFDVEIASDGEKGLAACEKEPDLIMLDIMLPKIDGLEIMKNVRQKAGWGSKVPIIITSNLNPDDDKIINSVATYNPAFYLVKAEHPLEEIIEKTKEILSGK